MTFLDAKGQVKEVQKIRVAEEDLNTPCDKINKKCSVTKSCFGILKFLENKIFFHLDADKNQN